jgi:hypothetical protein
MPNRWPINSGSWSDPTIWSGSLIPTASDDVFLNNQTVTLDQTVIVRSIRNTATGSAVVGGQLNIYSDYNITATPNGINSLGATVTGGFIKYYNSGSIIITGNLTQGRNTLENVNNGTINIIGNVFFAANLLGSARTVTNSSNGIINLVGNVTSSTAIVQTTFLIAILNSSNGTINITGNVSGGGNNFNVGVTNANTGIINITGNVTPGTSTISHGLNNTSIGTINLTGNIFPGTSTGTGIVSTTAGIINVIGQCIASTSSNAVSSTSTTATNIFSGPLINSGSRNAIYCYNVRLYDDVTTRYVIGVSGSNNTITLFSPDQVTGVPSGSDVRTGVIYGPGNELTGSMNVPHPNSVSYGVAVDNTTGSALVKPEDLWNIAITELTSSNSIGQRLSSTITSASMAAIVNSFS